MHSTHPTTLSFIVIAHIEYRYRYSTFSPVFNRLADDNLPLPDLDAQVAGEVGPLRSAAILLVDLAHPSAPGAPAGQSCWRSRLLFASRLAQPSNRKLAEAKLSFFTRSWTFYSPS